MKGCTENVSEEKFKAWLLQFHLLMKKLFPDPRALCVIPASRAVVHAVLEQSVAPAPSSITLHSLNILYLRVVVKN